MKRSYQHPLGPRPAFALEWERIEELQEAIRRYLEANWPLDISMVIEYNNLTERLEREEPPRINRLEKLTKCE